MFANIKYHSCYNYEEVFALLTDENLKSCIIAGGTDVVIGIRNNSSRFNAINTLIDLKNIKNIDKIYETESEVFIGSYATFTNIFDNEIIKKNYPLLISAVSKIGNLQVRNRATIGGNIVNCAPCADSVPPLLVYDADVVIRNNEKSYKIPLSEFLISPYKTKLGKTEVLEAVVLPKNKVNYKGKFVKLGKRKGVAISRLTFSILVNEENSLIKGIKIASGAITPIATRFYEIEEKFKNVYSNDDTIINLVTEIAKLILSKTGIRWSYPYKLPVFQQLLFNELKKLLQ
jgi:xanthine dehydrogenase FAD-binding subunit